MQERDVFIETEILKLLKDKHSTPVFRFEISNVKDPELMRALESLLAQGLVEGTVQSTGYDINIRRPTPFWLTKQGLEYVNSL